MSDEYEDLSPTDLEGEEEIEDGETEVLKRKKPTIMDHVAHYFALVELLDAEIDRKKRNKEPGIRQLRKIYKLITVMKKEMPIVAKSKVARLAFSTRRSSGFDRQYYMSGELAAFLQMDVNVDTVSRVDVARAMSAYINIKEEESRDDILQWSYLNTLPSGEYGLRNLQNPANKKTFIPDRALSKLLRLDKYKKDVIAGKITIKRKNKETGELELVKPNTQHIDFSQIQTLIGVHLLEPLVVEGTEEVPDDVPLESGSEVEWDV